MLETLMMGMALSVEEFTFPDGEPGRAIVIYEFGDRGPQAPPRQSWRYPMTLEQAKVTGTKLCGLGQISLPNGAVAGENGNGKGPLH
jgi:hypothetical protein